MTFSKSGIFLRIFNTYFLVRYSVIIESIITAIIVGFFMYRYL